MTKPKPPAKPAPRPKPLPPAPKPKPTPRLSPPPLPTNHVPVMEQFEATLPVSGPDTTAVLRDPHWAETMPIGSLHPDTANRRRHSERNVGMIAAALKAVGAARSIVIDEDLTCLAGNGVLEAAAAAGIAHVRIIDARGDELVAVRRSGLSDEQKRALAIYDNRTGELAEWNTDQLAADQAAGLDFAAWWTSAELLAVLGGFSPASEDEQGRLDQTTPITCPACGHEFTR